MSYLAGLACGLRRRFSLSRHCPVSTRLDHRPEDCQEREKRSRSASLAAAARHHARTGPAAAGGSEPAAPRTGCPGAREAGRDDRHPPAGAGQHVVGRRAGQPHRVRPHAGAGGSQAPRSPPPGAHRAASRGADHRDQRRAAVAAARDTPRTRAAGGDPRRPAPHQRRSGAVPRMRPCPARGGQSRRCPGLLQGPRAGRGTGLAGHPQPVRRDRHRALPRHVAPLLLPAPPHGEGPETGLRSPCRRHGRDRGRDERVAGSLQCQGLGLHVGPEESQDVAAITRLAQGTRCRAASTTCTTARRRT